MSAVVKTDIDRMIAEYRDGYTLPQAFYRSADIFAHDMESLIFRKWLLVDHESRIPNQGDYFLFEIANESIIIIRESEQRINAFFNVCRHRGSRVCLEQQGNKRLLTCPYHAWTYSLNGELRPPQLMPAGFDRSQFNLHKCHVTNFHGLIFVCLSGDAPPDFTEEYAPFDEMLDFHGFGDAKIAVKRDYPNRCNWKLVVENFIECYHCAPSHPEYCSVHPQDQLLALGAGPGSGPDNLAWVWDVTTRQDKKITEDNNAGISSSRYQPGPYSTQEAKVAAFIRWYLNSIR